MMNKKISKLCAGLILGVLAVSLQAQDNQTPRPAAAAAPVAPMISPAVPGSSVGPRTMMRDRTEMLAMRLKLTDEQKAKIKPIFDEETKQMQEIREKTQAKLKSILTPEQWEQYAHPGSGAFSQRLQNIVTRTNPIPVTPAMPAKAPAPAAK